ncbi:MAG TPA: peptide chain release factor 1, partial [archaeon]|nr:peptide chain release factor 1 [archaeon]
KGIIIGGPGPSKKEFNDNEYLPTDLQKKILVVKDIGYTDEYGLEELVQRSQDVLSEAAIAHEKALLEKFFVELQKGSGLVVYKPEDIQKALESGAVDMLIVSENARVMRCPSGHFTSDQKCHLCQMKTEEVDATDAFKDIAHQYGTKVEIISRDTREGQQLFNIGGLGATLRWRIG